MSTVAPDTVLNGAANGSITTQETTGTSSIVDGTSRSALNSPPTSLPMIPADVSSQRPLYEIKMELKVTEYQLIISFEVMPIN